MKIDLPTFKVAVRVFESRYGCLLDLLNDLTKRERRNLMRYGKLSNRVLEDYDKSKVEEFLNISFEFKQILSEVMKPRSFCRGRSVVRNRCSEALYRDISASAIKEARQEYELRYGSLMDLLAGFTKRETQDFFRYGKLSKGVIERGDESKIEELLNASFSFRQILSDVVSSSNRFVHAVG